MANIQISKLHRRLKATVKLPAVLNMELPRGTKGFLSQTYGGKTVRGKLCLFIPLFKAYGKKCLITAYRINFKLLNLK